jgi:hypothetical protein
MALDKVPIAVGQLKVTARIEAIAECGQHERLKLGGGNTANRSRRLRFILQHSLRDVIAIAHATLVSVGRAHAVAARIKDAAGQERG